MPNTDQQDRNLMRWIGALVSGKYKQTTGKLHDFSTNCYCANGVAADEFGFPHFGPYFFFGHLGNAWNESFSKLSLPIVWFRDIFGCHVQQHIVADMNDLGYSFEELAVYLTSCLSENAVTDEFKVSIAPILHRRAMLRRVDGKARISLEPLTDESKAVQQ